MSNLHIEIKTGNANLYATDFFGDAHAAYE